ncbi:MAG: hypothetical protein NT175_14525 [Bacteroidetes bacterium]|nr:hypothetical protein [Bacteroidota bacterium]
MYWKEILWLLSWPVLIIAAYLVIKALISRFDRKIDQPEKQEDILE